MIITSARPPLALRIRLLFVVLFVMFLFVNVSLLFIIYDYNIIDCLCYNVLFLSFLTILSTSAQLPLNNSNYYY